MIFTFLLLNSSRTSSISSASNIILVLPATTSPFLSGSFQDGKRCLAQIELYPVAINGFYLKPYIAIEFFRPLQITDINPTLSYEASSLPTHNDLSPYNRPYAKFRVAANDADYPTPSIDVDALNRWSWEGVQDWRWYQTASITPSGYRVPNLRELLIMGTRLPDDAWQTYEGRWLLYRHESKAMYMTYTSFSRGTYDGDGSISGKNGGFRFNAQDHSNGATSSDADGGYVRGVKDEQ